VYNTLPAGASGTPFGAAVLVCDAPRARARPTIGRADVGRRRREMAKQLRAVRFPPDLLAQIETTAVQRNEDFSSTVRRLAREALLRRVSPSPGVEDHLGEAINQIRGYAANANRIARAVAIAEAGDGAMPAADQIAKLAGEMARALNEIRAILKPWR